MAQGCQMSKYTIGYRTKCLIGKMHKVIILTPVESFIGHVPWMGKSGNFFSNFLKNNFSVEHICHIVSLCCQIPSTP